MDVREILIRITGNSADAERELNKVARKIIETGRVHARPSVDLVGIAAANTQLAGLETHLAALAAADVSPEVKVKVDRSLTDVARLRAELEALRKRIVDGQNATLHIDTNIAQIDGQVKVLEREFHDLSRLRPEVAVSLRKGQVQKEIVDLRRELAFLVAKKWTPEVGVKIADARARIFELSKELGRLNGTAATVVVKARVAEVLAEMAALRAEADRLDHERITIHARIDRDTEAIPGLLSRIGQAAARVGSSLASAGGPVNDLNSRFHGLLGAVKQINPIIQGFALIVTSLAIPAVIALATSFGAAVAGAGALAIALGGALGPALVGVIGLFQRFAQVLKVGQAEQTAIDQATIKGATNASMATSRYRALVDARQAVTDAQRAAGRASEQLAQAEADAANRIVEAQRNAQQTARDVAEARVQAYRDMQDAADRARDSILGVERAQEGIDEAKIGLRQARLDLKKFREEAGASGDVFDKLFKKFTDVDVNTSGLEDAIKKANKASGAKLDDQGELDLAKKILAVREAKTREKEATNGLRDANRENARAQQDNNKFLKQGIAASDGYRSAVQRNADAQRELNTLLKNGVHNAPAVVAAAQGVADANRAVERSVTNVRRVLKDNASAGADTTQFGAYLAQRKKLSKAEQDFADALALTKSAWNDLNKVAFAPVFKAGASALGLFSDSLGAIKGFMSDLGRIWAINLALFAADIKFSPGWQSGLKVLAQGAKDLSGILGGSIFRDFFGLLRNIAVAALPKLVSGFRDFGKSLSGLTSATTNSKKFKDAVGILVDEFGRWAKLGGAIFSSVLSFFVAAAPEAGKLVDYITAGFKAFGKWASSKKGRDTIAGFFKDTVPAAKSLIGFIVRLGKIALQVFQFFAPPLKVVLDSFNLVLDVISFILGLLNKIPAPIRGLLAIFFPFGTIFGRLGKLLKPLGGLFKAVFGAALRVGKPVFEFFGRFAGRLRGPFVAAIKYLSTPFRAVLGAIIKLARNIFHPDKWLGIITGAFSKVLKWLANSPLIKPFRLLADGIVKVFRALKGRLFSAFGFVGGLVKTVINSVVSILNGFIHGINKVTPGKIKILGHTVFPGVPDIPDVPLLAAGGLTTGSTLAQIGEAGREAVLPLQGAALRTVAQAIAGELAVALRSASGSLVPAGAAAGAGAGVFIKEQNINVTTAGGGSPDEHVLGSRIGRSLRRRGKG